MITLAIFLLCALLVIKAPSAAGMLANLIAFGFILPFFTLAMGTFIWGVWAVVSWGEPPPWGSCLLFGGVPFGLLMLYFVKG